MKPMSYRDLSVWQKAMDLAVGCYQLAKKFPKEERYGLTSQLQRAAVSVPANIAEGRGRRQTKPFIQFLAIAGGSLAEVETHLILAQRLGYAKENDIVPLLEQATEIVKMLHGLQNSLKTKIPKS